MSNRLVSAISVFHFLFNDPRTRTTIYLKKMQITENLATINTGGWNEEWFLDLKIFLEIPNGIP